MSYLNIESLELPFAFRYFADLKRYRHLCWNLVASDLRSRFRRSRLGVLWAVVQPLAFALMIAMVYGQVFRVESYWTYAVYVFSGMIVWESFTTVVTVSQDSLVGAMGYLKQSRIPFLIFQLRVPLCAMVILGFGFVGLVIMQAILGQLPHLGFQLLLIPVFAVVLMLFLSGVAVFMSIVGAQFRDVKYMSMIAIQALFFVSPVMLARDFLNRPELQFLHYINPAVPLLDMFRAPLIYGRGWTAEDLGVIAIWIAVIWAAAGIATAKAGRRLVFVL